MNTQLPTGLLRRFSRAAGAVLVGLAAGGAAHAADDGWNDCADEGQTCQVSGRALVRFGVDDRWVNRTVRNSVACSNEFFGDPAPDVPKRCQVRGASQGGGGGSSVGWSFCAAEGEVCRFNGVAQVRFGQGGRFVTRTAYGSVRCDVQDFGDPASGVTKFCEVNRTGGPDRPNSDVGYWAAAGGKGAWRYCAAEDGTCRVRGSGQVRFGDGRNFRTRNARGDVACNVATFGDPAYGRIKHCEVQARSYGAGSSPGWRRCAAEGQRCSFKGTVQARYGAAGRYVYRDGTDGVRCDSNYFGGDPYPNRSKTCEIRR